MERARGAAKQHQCACGQPARQWAFRGLDPSGYSLDPNDYEAMCVSCHMKVDLGEGTAHAKRLAEISSAGNEALAVKFQDPAYRDERRAKASEAGKLGGAKVAQIKKVCAECGLSANPGNLAQHQTFSGHKGVLDGSPA